MKRLFTIPLFLMANLGFAQQDIEFVLPPGGSLVTKDNSGQSVRLQVKDSGEIVIPAIPSGKSSIPLCHDPLSGELRYCAPEATGYVVVDSEGTVVGDAFGWIQPSIASISLRLPPAISTKKFSAQVGIDGFLDQDSPWKQDSPCPFNNAFYESTDCSGQAYCDASVFSPASQWSIYPLPATQVQVSQGNAVYFDNTIANVEARSYVPFDRSSCHDVNEDLYGSGPISVPDLTPVRVLVENIHSLFKPPFDLVHASSR